MQHVILYAATAVAFLALDAVWLKVFVGPLFERHVGELLRPDPDLGIAAGFYAVYVVGILYFASGGALSGKGLDRVAIDAALFGFFCYGTYELTNFATLKGWHWTMVAADLSWGTALTAVSAVIGVMVTRAVSG